MAAAAGDLAIRATRRALGITVAAAIAFTTFAVITTQDKAVRAGSPWQNDPYDGLVSFTELLVPALVILIAVRGALLRRSGPQPVFRLDQLLRASFVCVLLIAVTVATDAIATAIRADRPLWTVVTPWLIWSLVPLAALTAAALVAQHRARTLLPTGRPAGDWIDDLAVLADAVTTRLPRPVRGVAGRINRSRTIDALRRHIAAVAAAIALAVSLLSAAIEGVGEGWSSPLLYLTDIAIGFGGLFAFAMLCNAVLRIAVARTSPARTRWRAAMWAALLTGSAAAPMTAVTRDGIWSALRLPGAVDSPARFAAVTFGGALVAAAAALAVAVLYDRVNR